MRHGYACRGRHRYQGQDQAKGGIRYGILCLAAFFGLVSAGFWYERTQMSKLDRAAKTAAVTGIADSSALGEPAT
jgi:hypothetical protein